MKRIAHLCTLAVFGALWGGEETELQLEKPYYVIQIPQLSKTKKFSLINIAQNESNSDFKVGDEFPLTATDPDDSSAITIFDGRIVALIKK